MIWLVSLIFFVFGTAVGSFLNVVAYRSVHGGSILFDYSNCPKCKHRLAVLDLVPILSFIYLKGRCRYCGKKISVQYPLVELATGALFALTFYVWWLNSTVHPYYLPVAQTNITYVEIVGLVYLLFVTSVFIALFVTDLVDGLLPNSVILPAIAAVVVFKLVLILFPFSHLLTLSAFLTDLVASFLVASVFFAIVYFSRERALGGGDIKLVFLITLAVGWPSILVGLFAGFLTGGFVAVMLILTGRKRFGQTVPLGPFLVFGSLIALFWGQEILDFYLRALG